MKKSMMKALIITVMALLMLTPVSVSAFSEEIDTLTICGLNFTDTLIYGDSGKYVTAYGGGEGEVSYVSDDETVISVSPDGALTVHKAGTATITAIKQSDGINLETSASMFITVNKRPIFAIGATLAPKNYDGTKIGEATSVEILEIIEGDELILNQDFYAVADFDNENAGKDRYAHIYVYLNATDNAENYYLGVNNHCIAFNLTIYKAIGGAVSVTYQN